MKKGFTLIEIIASIALILIISLIVVRNVSTMSDKSKRSIYEGKIDLALLKAEDYGSDILDDLSSECTTVSIGKLIEKNYLESEKDNAIYDPRTNESMNDILICITYNNGKINTYLKEEN